MAQQKLGSAGVTGREIDRTTRVSQEPVGVPAGIIGTSLKGPAFVPVTLGTIDDFYARFGKTDGRKFGPLAVTEWMRYSTSVSYLKVMGVGDGTKRLADGTTAGAVTSAGFVVGENQPQYHDNLEGAISGNPYANSGSNSVLGRTYVLGCFMSESRGSTVFSAAGLQGTGSVTPSVTMAVPIVRGLVMAASGVILRLSSSFNGTNTAPASSLVATDGASSGKHLGHVTLLKDGTAKQEFIVFLNGHKGTDATYPNVITASFDLTAPNYFANVLNVDPFKMEQAGHYLYASWDVHPTTAVVTGTGLVAAASGSGATATIASGKEACAFLTTGSADRNVGTAYVPNYENFETRFEYAKSPWVVSQRFGGSEQNLIRFHALDAGADVSSRYKISIENIVPSSDSADLFPNFDVVIRSWDDRDGEQVPLEQWRGVNLNPSSDRYIAAVIGDMHAYYDFDRSLSAQKLVVEGNYPNASVYVRVEIATDVESENVDPESFPMGFRGAAHLVTSGTMPLTAPTSDQLLVTGAIKRAVTPPVPFRTNITAGTGAKKTVNPLLYWGAQFEHVTSLTTPNASTMKNESLDSWAKFFPDFMTNSANVVVGDNEGEVDTAELGVVDADRFCNNKFSLENIRVVTGSTGLADPTAWVNATYVRNGAITADDSEKTRRVSIDDFIQANRRFLKFSFFMQGGFNGTNIFNQDEAELTNAAVNADMDDSDRGLNNGPNVMAYLKALEIMRNTTNVDIKLLAIPGLRNSVVQDAGILAVQDRFDAMYVMDIENYDTENNRVTSDDQQTSVDYSVQALIDRSIDSSFVASYFPDQVMRDPTTKTNVVVPPSVVVLGAIALNDQVAHPWFAPAGFARGALTTTLESKVFLKKENMDALADANINPLASFPGSASSGTNPKGGVTVWGQKTMQASASALDRVNVRRLLIELRRMVRDVTRTVVFEPNRESTLASIVAALTPKFRKVQAQAGLNRFKIIFDASTTTQADIENNTIRGKIYVQPTKTIENVFIDFVVSNNNDMG